MSFPADRVNPFLNDSSRARRFTRFPAYGKQMLEARRRGLQPRQKTVLVVFDWQLAKAFPRIVIDPTSDFSSLNFSYLVGLDVIIGFHQGEASLLEALALVIMKANPRRLQGWPLEPDDEGRFKTRFFRIAAGNSHGSL